MNDQIIIKKLQNYFFSKGLELQKKESGILQFSDGIKKVAVYFTERNYKDKNQLLGLMLGAAANIQTKNQSYLAIPKLYGSILDAKNLESNGLGLILYDEMGIYEVLPAKFFDSKNRDSVNANIKFDTEIRKLRLEIQTLKEDLTRIKNEMEGLRDRKIVEKAIQPIDKPIVENQGPVQDEGLPKFFKNNPWITVLSERGVNRM